MSGKLDPAPLSKDEIEEELVNNDLLNSGAVDEQDLLEKMNIEDKKNLLKTLNQSKEEYHNESSQSSSAIDNSQENFPSLPTVGKRNSMSNKLRLPRKYTESDAPKRSINLSEDEEEIPEKPVPFCLPGCINDDAPPLAAPDRLFIADECPYYQLDTESASAATRRMLAHHNAWKSALNAIQSPLHQSDERDFNESSDHEDRDVLQFRDSPVRKVYSNTKKREPSEGSDHVLSSNSRLQRRSSRDSDCTDVEPIMKPESHTISDWIPDNISIRQRSTKRNRKQVINPETKNQSPDSDIHVEFDFQERWDSQASGWNNTATTSSGAHSLSQPASRRSLPKTPVPLPLPVVEEEKVQCPICQRNFPQSKVETHAATCEGYSVSPMDVEEES